MAVVVVAVVAVAVAVAVVEYYSFLIIIIVVGVKLRTAQIYYTKRRFSIKTIVSCTRNVQPPIGNHWLL